MGSLNKLKHEHNETGVKCKYVVRHTSNRVHYIVKTIWSVGNSNSSYNTQSNLSIKTTHMNRTTWSFCRAYDALMMVLMDRWSLCRVWNTLIVVLIDRLIFLRRLNAQIMIFRYRRSLFRGGIWTVDWLYSWYDYRSQHVPTWCRLMLYLLHLKLMRTRS